ncbi:MAG: CpXC domain-containing protein [Oscillospiraceae bacterium]
MSTQIKKDIICPKCGQSDKLAMLTGVNNAQNPEFKGKILSETLFDWRCPKCGYCCQMVYPLVFHDPKKAYMIALTPSAGKAKTIEPTPEIANIIKRRVKSLAEMKEKIMIFDSGLDDVAVELVKNALCSIIRNSYKSNKIKAYFSRICPDKGLEFAIFLGGKKEALYHATKAEVYNQSAEVLRSLNFSEPNQFLRVGPTLAEKILQEYKSL